jgi:DNA-binding SARP family transcriptional activator/thioredoxin-like negative regulator of GroEL
MHQRGAIEIRLLGGLSAHGEPGRDAGGVLAQPKRSALLAYLAVSVPQSFLRRDVLLSIFWPESDQAHARAALRKALHFLRQELGPDLIQTRGDEEVGLAPTRWWCDAVAFEVAASARQWETAMDLYRGDFLAGFHLGDAPAFERWTEDVRARLREEAVKASWAIGRAEEEAGRREGALRWARRTLELAPYDEAGLRRLLTILVEGGDRAGAVIAYDQFAARLAVELELEPSAETLALVGTARRQLVVASVEAPSSVTEPRPEASRASRRLATVPPARSSRLVRLPIALLLTTLVIGGVASALRPPAGLAPRQRVLVADFGSPTQDTTLGRLVTGALRIDLSQSSIVTIVSSARVTDVLEQMRVPVTTSLTPELARELALRDGIEAVIVGDVAAVGTQYVLSASLLTGRGEVLAATRETARDSNAIIGAVDRLSKSIRWHIGEALTTLRSDPPLSQVTTSSLEALRKYTEAGRAIDQGDASRALILYESALALDSSFAAAYLGLASLLFNAYEHRMSRIAWALTRAYDLRERLVAREHHLATTAYDTRVRFDFDKGIAAHRVWLERSPHDAEVLEAMGVAMLETHRFAQAETVYRQALAVDSSSYFSYLSLVDAQLGQGHRAEAMATLERTVAAFPGNEELDWWHAELEGMVGDYHGAERRLRASLERNAQSRYFREWNAQTLANIAAVRGRFREAEGWLRDGMAAAIEDSNLPRYYDFTGTLATYLLRGRGEPRRALQVMEDALAVYPFDTLPPLDRPYLLLAQFYALAGQPFRSRQVLAEYERSVDPRFRRLAEPHDHTRYAARGEAALAEGRVQDAIAEFRKGEGASQCPVCGMESLARAYETSGQTDSAVAAYERRLRTLWGQRVMLDAVELPLVYRRLGALYETRGELEKAKGAYTRFIDLWKNCDPEVQPQVAEVRRQVHRLQASLLSGD